MSDALLSCYVYGTPRTKGSMRPMKTPSGRVRLVEEVKDGPEWRKTMARAIMPEIADRIGTGERATWRLREGYPYRGPVSVVLEFHVIEPAGDTGEWPVDIRIGDVDKLTRNVLDVLSAPTSRGQASTGVIVDDSQVCDLTASKRFASATGALPGVRIEVWPI